MVRQAKVEDVKQIARIHVNSWKIAYKGIINGNYLDNLEYDKRKEFFKERILENNPEKFVYVYEDDEINQVVAFITFGKAEKDENIDGEVYALYVLHRNQKQGIGKLLISAAIDKFRELNYKNLIIWALRDNLNARGFYEKMGGRQGANKTVEIGKQMLDEVSYVIDII